MRCNIIVTNIVTGRLKITRENGRNPTTGEYDALYSFGGRSFSIRRADDMSLVYDSGGDIAYQTARLHPDLFNNDIYRDVAVSATMDTRSDDKVLPVYYDQTRYWLFITIRGQGTPCLLRSVDKVLSVSYDQTTRYCLFITIRRQGTVCLLRPDDKVLSVSYDQTTRYCLFLRSDDKVQFCLLRSVDKVLSVYYNHTRRYCPFITIRHQGTVY